MENIKFETNDDRSELFIKLLAQDERALTRYVMALVPAVADAEDILQESKLVMWRQFGDFTEGTSFTAWARKIIFYRILSFRKVKAKEADRYVFSDAFYDVLDEDYKTNEKSREKQFVTLQACINKLQDPHKQMVMLRYHQGKSIEGLADSIGRTVAACYKTLSRIRMNLKRCVQKAGV
ncbi:MAG: sigma-70 family RNA polymerase sigma factor [Lentisphaeraceae bacterium]|nr:sigma-70 family RNA polymerase sigma factor [Lentisphaeraceae bacterium]